jgi:hypothetical protein
VTAAAAGLGVLAVHHLGERHAAVLSDPGHGASW